MKMKFVLVLLMGFAKLAFSQQQGLYVDGKNLFNACKEKVVLRGVNYPVLDDWDFPANLNNGNEKLSEIEKTGANCVRIMWYNNYNQPARPAFDVSHLDALLTRCASNKIIPVVGLWDLTCSNDWNAFQAKITNWWVRPDVVQLVNKHSQYFILNFANEAGHYTWTGNTTSALANFTANYKTAIAAVRNAGLQVPLMIDAPDCGANADALIAAGQALLAADPLHNLIFSTHAYWISFATNDPNSIANKVQQMANSNLPFVFGEIANYQADGGDECKYQLNYPTILTNAKQFDIGWLAWSWYKDNCSQRQMTPSGLFNNLNAYGSDLVNNKSYGLLATSVKSDNTFTNCPAPPNTGESVVTALSAVSRQPNHMEVYSINTDGSIRTDYFYDFNKPAWNNYPMLPAGSSTATGKIASVSRFPGTLDVFWIAPNGSVQNATYYEKGNAGWDITQIAMPGSAAINGTITAVSRQSSKLSIWWTGADQSVQCSSWEEKGLDSRGGIWSTQQVAPAGSIGSGNIAAVSRLKGTMEIWWVAPNGSIKDGFWYEGMKEWGVYELLPPGTTSHNVAAVAREGVKMAVSWISNDGKVFCKKWKDKPNENGWLEIEQIAPAGSAFPKSSITALSRSGNALEVWWIGKEGHVMDGWWYEGMKSWEHFAMNAPKSAALTSEIRAVSRVPAAMEIWFRGANNSIKALYWYEGGKWSDYVLKP